MDIFETVIDEIALSGLDGCTLEELWSHLTKRNYPNAFPLVISEQVKCYVWSLLYSSSSGYVNFFELNSPRQLQESNSVFTCKYRLVNEPELKGSCWDYDVRKDVTSTILSDTSNSKLSEVTERYADNKLVLVAVQEIRTRALLSPSCDPLYSINEVQYCVLELVGRCREKGIFRTDITNKFFKIDARSTFHHVAVLTSANAVIVKVASGGHLIFLTRYAAYTSQLPTPTASLPAQICAMLSEAPDNTLPVSEVVDRVKSVKRFNNAKRTLLDKACVEVVKASKDKPAIIKLIKPFHDKVEVETADKLRMLSGEEMDLDESVGEAEDKYHFVGELPLSMQAYRLLDRAGPSGMIQAEFLRSIQGLDYRKKRLMLKNLNNSSCVTSVMLDDDSVRKMKYVSKRHANQNTVVQNLKTECEKFTQPLQNLSIQDTSSLLDDATETADTSIADEEVESILNNVSHHDEDGPSSRSSSVVSMPVDMTTDVKSDQSFDNRVITLKKMKRINYILDYVKKQVVVPSDVVIYKGMLASEGEKGLARLDRKTFHRLLSSLCKKGMIQTRTVEMTQSENNITRQQSIYYDNSATESQVSDVIQEIEVKFSGITKKEKERIQREKNKAEKALKAVESQPTVEVPVDFTSDDKYVFMPVTSRYQRLHHLHLFLWMLKHGDSPGNDEALSPVTFPWLSAVHQVDHADHTIKWNTIMNNLPLSLVIILVGVVQQRLPRKLYECIQLPANRNRLLNEFPINVQYYFTEAKKRRHATRLYQLLLLLDVMKLVIVHEPTGNIMKANVSVELVPTVTILDTSTAKPRHSCFRNEARSKFNSITYQLDSISNIQSYWLKLKTICLSTKMFKRKGEETAELSDEDALPFPKYRKNENFDQLGFGAGGLSPSLFSHVIYNWGSVTFFKLTEKNSASKDTYQHEITYTDIPTVDMSSDSLDDGKQQQVSRSVLTAGRPKRRLAGADGDSVVVSAAKRVKKAVSQAVQRNKSKGEGGNYKRLDHTKYLNWTKEEDGVLMRCYVANSILAVHKKPIPSPFQLREIIQSLINCSRYRTGVAVFEHMEHVSTSDAAVTVALNKCTDQILDMIKNGSGPPVNFQSLLHYLIDNYSGCVPTVLTTSPSATLPSLPMAVEEFSESCRVDEPRMKTELFLPPVCDVRDVRKSMLIDLIISSVGADPDSYDEVTAHQMLEQYLEQELQDCVDLLKEALLIRKRILSRDNYKEAGRHLGPRATQMFFLHPNFHTRLEASFSPELFAEITKYLTHVRYTTVDSDDGQPCGGETAAKLVMLACSNHFCSLVTNDFISDMTSYNITFPTDYFITKKSPSDSKPLPMEDEDDDNDDDGETVRDVKNIEAYLPYTSSLAVPNHRKFCDVTFSHGQGVGALLDNNDVTEDVTDDVTNNVTDDVTKIVTNDVTNNVTDDVTNNVTNNVTDDVTNNVTDDVTDDVTNNVTDDVTNVDMEQLSGGKELAQEERLEMSVPEFSIDDYSSLCMEHLNFSETDVLFAKRLYKTISQAGAMGISIPCLKQQINESYTNIRLEDHLQQMKNFELIIEVGVSEIKFVTMEHVGVWLLDMQDKHNTEDSRRYVKCRPWTSLCGQDMNTTMFEKMKIAILQYIMDYPGVTLQAIEHHFTGVLQMNAVRDILQVLIVSGCVSCHRLIKQRSCDLFSSDHSIVVPSDVSDDTPSNIYFEPLLGCELVQCLANVTVS